MLNPNLNIWALLLYAYTLYGCGYALGLTMGSDEGDEPGVIAVVFVILLWPFFKGLNDGAE